MKINNITNTYKEYLAFTHHDKEDELKNKLLEEFCGLRPKTSSVHFPPQMLPEPLTSSSHLFYTHNSSIRSFFLLQKEDKKWLS